MKRSTRVDLPAMALITAVAILVWSWSAGETRSSIKMQTQATFVYPDGNTVVFPSTEIVQCEVEGSRRALRRAATVMASLTLTLDDSIPLDDSVSGQQVSLREQINEHPEVQALGVTVVNVQPETLFVAVTPLVERDVPVRRTLPGVDLVQQMDVRPASVSVSMSETLYERLGERIDVEVALPPEQIVGAEPGRRLVFEGVGLRIAGGVSATLRDAVTITPDRVDVTVVVPSTETLAVEYPVRINVLVSPDDDEQVSIEPDTLRDVVIEGPDDVLAAVGRRDAVVMAVLYLRSGELERRIERKPISGFVVVMPDGSMVPVRERRSPDAPARGPISLEIRPPDEQPEPPSG